MRRGAQGFTLLEVMIAMSLLAVGLVAVMGLLNRSLSLHGRAREIRADAEMAAELMGTLELRSADLRREAQTEIEKRYAGRRFDVGTESVELPGVQRLAVRIYRGDDREPSHQIVSFVETETAP